MKTCIRAEQGYCSISYTAVSTIGFQVGSYDSTGVFAPSVGPTTNALAFSGAACSNDYITIPFGGSTLGATTTVDKFCGAFLNAISASTASATVFSSQLPFVIDFVSNGNEQDAAAGGVEVSRGYQIYYSQSTTCP